MTPAVVDNYVMRAPRYGQYRVALNSDDARFGGSAYWGDDQERVFVTEPATGSEAEDRYRKLNEALEHKKASIQKKREKLEQLRLELVADYRDLLSSEEYEQPEESGHALRGLEVPIAELPDLVPQYQEPTLTIDLPPLCALYLELLPEE